MVNFTLNGKEISIEADKNKSLLSFLRNDLHITSVKDGCSGEGVCGACLVEINGSPRLSCKTKILNLEGKEIFTLEGFSEHVKDIIAGAFVEKGAVQCGFCTPGFIVRAKTLLDKNPNPTEEEIQKAIKGNLCRCTGYKKIEQAIGFAADIINGESKLAGYPEKTKIGDFLPKYQAYKTALGQRKFVADMFFDNMFYSALKFSDYPRAKIIEINTEKAESLQGVVKVFLASDIPGNRYNGLIKNDWPLYIDKAEHTNYIGDVIAGVVAKSEEIARKAVGLIEIKYEVLQPVTNPLEALEKNSPQVHDGVSNLLETCVLKRADVDIEIEKSDYLSSGKFNTQRIEHAFLEVEAAIALPDKDGILLYSQSQGVYEDRRQLANILNLPEEKVRVKLVPNGGGFGGKEDLSVQGHAALFAFVLKQPVKLCLSRSESIRMHPKRHPISIDIKLACNKKAELTAIKVEAIGDTGAYASVGDKVLERVAGHATGAYYIPNVDVVAKTVYTNNIPCGAMRGFGANQMNFALESCIDDLCELGSFDRWEFRYRNALVDGLRTATGQKLYGVGVRACLLALKDDFYNADFAGIACGIKNSGIGNGMVDFSKVKVSVLTGGKVLLEHGWTEMGQGVNTIAVQVLSGETGISPDKIEVKVDTAADIKTGMTTSSRATVLLGNAIIEVAKRVSADLANHDILQLEGNVYKAEFAYDKTTKPGDETKEPITHYSYGYAAQLCVLDKHGKIDEITAAHDGGKIMNPVLFEGQIEGAVHMGTGYAISENLPMKDGFLVSDTLRDCGVLRSVDTPKITVKMIEVKDPVGPYGAKGIGEIGLVPTAAAIANAYCKFSNNRQFSLPLQAVVKPEGN